MANGWGGRRDGAGRKRGSKNKITAEIRDNVVDVFEKLGGIEHMKEWAETHPNEFYRMYSRLLPRPVELSGEDTAQNITFKFFDQSDLKLDKE